MFRVEGNTSELEGERLLYDPEEQLQLFHRLSEITLNNIDQENIFNTCMESIRLGRRKCIFIDGPGGTGKTTVIKRIIAKARAQGKIVKICASTTLAATLYEMQLLHTAFSNTLLKMTTIKILKSPHSVILKELIGYSY